MNPQLDVRVFDGHNDTLLALFLAAPQGGRNFFERSNQGHIDFPRARDGNFGGGFFAVFVPSPPTGEGSGALQLKMTDTSYAVPLPDPLEQPYAQQVVMAMIANLFRLESQSAGGMRVVRTVAELRTCLATDVLAAILHIEGAEAIDAGLDALYVFHQAGLRSLGLVWSRPNIFGHGVPFQFPSSPDTGPGLTEAGKNLVRVCNQLGILIDLSHLNERGFWDVAELSTAPLVATHSAAYTLCPSSRNLTDKQLDAIRESDGLVGLNFATAFIRPDGRNDPNTPLDVLVRQIEYLVDRLGIDHVALGSDFDGATVPKELGDVTGLPKLLAALHQRGYDVPALAKLAHLNWLRVLTSIWIL